MTGSEVERGSPGRPVAEIRDASPSTPSSGRAGDSDRSSLYQKITSRIIAELEAGRLPWVQPWGTVVQQDFSGQSWLTFRQARALGGHVRKGERGTTVVFAHRFTPGPSTAARASTVTIGAPYRF